MNYIAIFCLSIIAIYSTANGQSSPEKDYYTGAVVEYAPAWNKSQTPAENIRRNVDEYLLNIKQAKDQGADIIVFPECGLTSLHLPVDRTDLLPFTSPIPEPRTREVPCGKDAWTDVLKRLSCAARDSGIYLVVNLPERQSIDGNEANGDNVAIFNTNVVFDRTGALIAKYRKYNLFSEPGFNVTKIPETVSFQTDFGVIFGTFICFDILFAKPALQLLKQNPSVTDIVYPTAWFSELPFLTAVQTQAGWARANGVNLLAAGYSDPAGASGGSGIFQADGDIRYTVPVSRLTSLVVRQIKKIKHRVVPDTVDSNTAKVENGNGNARLLGQMHTMKEDMRNYTTVLVNSTNVEGQKICHEKFCCTFTVKFAAVENVDYRYRMIVYEGPRFFGIQPNNVQICGLAACKGTTKDTCGERIENSVNPQVFEEISITGDFKNDDNTVVFPSNARYDLSVLTPSAFEFRVTGANCHKTVQMTLTERVDQLLAFGVYGVTKSSAGGLVAFMPLVVVTVVTLFLWSHFKN